MLITVRRTRDIQIKTRLGSRLVPLWRRLYRWRRWKDVQLSLSQEGGIEVPGSSLHHGQGTASTTQHSTTCLIFLLFHKHGLKAFLPMLPHLNNYSCFTRQGIRYYVCLKAFMIVLLLLHIVCSNFFFHISGYYYRLILFLSNHTDFYPQVNFISSNKTP